MNTFAPLPIQAGFIILTALFFSLLIIEVRRALPKTTLDPRRQRNVLRRLVGGLLLWAIFVSGWSLSGRMANFDQFPFNMAPILAIPLIAIVLISISRTTGEVLSHIPLQNIIRLQTFRLFVELLLWALFIQQQLPVQMTFEGRNFDVLSGITAPVVAFLAARNKISRVGLIVWNVVCLGLLINILATAILSMPTPIRVFVNEPANTIVTTFPVSWLPAFLVPLAYGLHFLSVRQLLSERKTMVGKPAAASFGQHS